MEAREASAEPPQLFFAQGGLNPGEDLVFFEAHVVVEQLAESGQFRLKVSVRSQARGQLFDARADEGVLRQHLHNGRQGVEGDVAGECGKENLFFLAEVQPPRGLPEAEVVAGNSLYRGATASRRLGGPSSRVAGLRINGAADEQRLHQSVVVVLAEGVQAGVTLHRPRGYYFFSVRT